VYYIINSETHEVTEFNGDKQALDDTLRVMKMMRWVKVRRHGRKGNRYFEVRMRNRQEWKQGYIAVDGNIKARLI